MDELACCLEVAQAAVQEAAAAIRAVAGQPRRIEYKSAIDLVTEIDGEIEALVGARLRAAFPSHLIVGEEASAGRPARPAPDQWAWYLDPIDGTTNFAHGHPQVAVSLGLARGAQLELGVVCDPGRDETFAARRGAGATLNGRPIRVSPIPDLGAALLASGMPYDRRVHLDAYFDVFKAFVMRAQGIRRAGSAALDLCWLACGRFDGYWEWKLSPWDTAAGVLIVREAGGVVSDFTGGPFDLYGNQILATNAHLHAAMIDVLRAFPPPP